MDCSYSTLRFGTQSWPSALWEWDPGLWKDMTEAHSPSNQRWVKVMIFMNLRSDIVVNGIENWQVDPSTCGNVVYSAM